MRPMIVLALAAVAASCATYDGRGLVRGQSTAAEVHAAMGKPAEQRPGTNGETVYYYPQLPWGHASYAARVGADGKLIAVEQRLTEDNIKKVVRGQTTMKEVRDLLGPPWEPLTRPHREIWTYPMRIPADPTPKWFVVQMSSDGVVRETMVMDDWQFVPKDSPGRRP